MTIIEYYQEQKQRFLENCTQCGICAQGCPILPYVEGGERPPEEIQSGVFDFLEGDVPNSSAYTKAFACMECFKCTADVCPEDLNPMIINEFVKGEYIADELADSQFSDPGAPDSSHRVLAGLQVSGDAYRRITTPHGGPTAPYVFFPGCNVYFQPEKILAALDLMDAIGDEYAFLPGLDYCCGDCGFFFGDICEGGRRAEALVAALDRFKPAAVVLWCPTCHCRFEKMISPALDIPFELISFPQYLAERLHRIPLSDAAIGTVTLHEACKSAYTGVDVDGARRVLQQLPGISLEEMEHHGSDAMCCGSGAICWFPESSARFLNDRLAEAADTGADRLVTVCHYCSQIFAAEEPHHDFTVTSYVNLVSEAMGIYREDKFQKYLHWQDADRILEDAAPNIAASPFPREKIEAVVRDVFGENQAKSKEQGA